MHAGTSARELPGITSRRSRQLPMVQVTWAIVIALRCIRFAYPPHLRNDNMPNCCSSLQSWANLSPALAQKSVRRHPIPPSRARGRNSGSLFLSGGHYQTLRRCTYICNHSRVAQTRGFGPNEGVFYPGAVPK